MQIPFMPFRILALAPFRLDDEIWAQQPVFIDNIDLDAVMDKLGVSFYLPIPEDLCPAGGLNIKFSKLKDFHPDALVQNNSFLSHLLEAKGYLTGAETRNISAQEKEQGLKQWRDLPPIRIKSEKKHSKPTSANKLEDILNMVALPGEISGPAPKVQTESVQIDYILQQVLNHIFINEKFRQSESAWRGLKLLLQQIDGDSDVKLEIVPATLSTLEETLDNLTANLIHHLPSLILIDLPFDNSPFCINLLKKISRLAETLLVPAMVWITPRFLQLDSWKDLNKLPFLPNYLDEPVFGKWRGLNNQTSANWIGVTCNRFLLRYPYGGENMPRKFPFHEHLQLWTAPVWATACLIVQSLIKTGWPTRFNDWQDIKIDNLALDMKSTPRPIPTEASFTEDRIDQFRRSGIMPLAAIQDKDVAFVPLETTMGGVPLSYQLMVSRIIHFILWCKDNLPKELEAAQLEKELRQAFLLFWEKSGHAVPQDLEISAGHSGTDNRIPFRIALQPSRKILPSGETIVLDFDW